jgi:hypothetical protein
MDTHASLLVYKELADCYEVRGEASMRDRFLVLAADAALASGMPEEAERLRQRLLQVNPHHLLRPYGTFAEALQAPDVRTYVRDLRLNYPLDTAESLLRSVRDDAAPPSAQEEPAAAPPPAAEKPVYPVREEPRAAQRPAVVARTVASRKAIPLPAPSAPAVAPAARPAAKPTSSVPISRSAARPAPASQRGPAARVDAPLAPPLKAPAVARRPLPRRRADEPSSGSWLSSLLFGLFVVAGAAVAVFALGRPFMPPSWLP